MKAERKVKLKTTFSFALAILTLGLSGCTPNDHTVLPAGIADLENLTVFPADAEPEQKIEFEEIVVLYTERVHISFYDLEGRYIRSFFHPFKNLALNRDELINRYENEILRSAYRGADIPDTMPAISSMSTDSEGRIWLGFVQPTGEELRNYWVLNSDGTKLVEFGWPSERQIQFIKNGYLFSVETDESGAQAVVQYQFVFNS